MCNAYRAHRHGSESPYPGSTPVVGALGEVGDEVDALAVDGATRADRDDDEAHVGLYNTHSGVFCAHRHVNGMTAALSISITARENMGESIRLYSVKCELSCIN